MTRATSFAKYNEVRELCETAVYSCRKKIASEYEARGNTREDSAAYSAGYMQSFLVNLIADLPKKQREEILRLLNGRAAA